MDEAPLRLVYLKFSCGRWNFRRKLIISDDARKSGKVKNKP